MYSMALQYVEPCARTACVMSLTLLILCLLISHAHAHTPTSELTGFSLSVSCPIRSITSRSHRNPSKVRRRPPFKRDLPAPLRSAKRSRNQRRPYHGDDAAALRSREPNWTCHVSKSHDYPKIRTHSRSRQPPRNTLVHR